MNSRQTTIFNFIESNDDFQSMRISEVPGVSLEIAEVFRNNESKPVELATNLMGLALTFLSPNSNLEEAAFLLMTNLMEHYGVIDYNGLITEAIFTKINSLILTDDLPESSWFERAGNEINFNVARDLLIKKYPELYDVFMDYKSFGSFGFY